MIATGRRRRAAIVIAACLLAAAGANAGLTPASARTAQAGGTASGTELATDPCPGDLIVVDSTASDGPTMCTHGPDPGVSPDDLAAQGGATAEASAGIQCYGNGTSGARVQLLYAFAGTNRLATLRDDMEQRAAEINAIYDASAQQTGGHRYVRWLTDANCNLDIRAVQVAATDIAVSGFSTGLLPRLTALNFDSNSRKYLIWVDTGTPTTIRSGTCSGVGTLFPDESTSPSQNWNNLFAGYTRIDDKCLFPLFDRVGGKVEAHELMHTLGAVQGPSARTTGSPHHTLFGHCTDDYDIMCYVDGPGTVVRTVCNEPSNEMRLDCNHDDYFSTNPRSGTYLATHWNTANSDWLESEPGAAQAPDAPQAVRGVPGDGQVTLTWSPPSSDGGEPVLGYQVYRNGQLVVPTTSPGASAGPEDPAVPEVTTTATSLTDVGLVNGTTYNYQVAAVNVVGEGAKTAAVGVMAGIPRPDAMVAPARSGPFQVDNAYFTSVAGNPQTQTQNVAGGGSVIAYVRVQNDRPGADSFKVKGATAGSSGYTVRYFRGTTDITAQVEAGSYAIDNLAPGAFVDLKVKITATTGAAAGSSRSVTVTVKSKTTKTIKDVVQTRAVRT